MSFVPPTPVTPPLETQPRRKWKILATVGLAVIGTSVLAWSLYQSSYFQLISPEIFISQGDSPYFISASKPVLSELAKIEGMRIWQIDVDQISSDIQKLPWVKEVYAQRTFPNKFRIEIDPRRIVLAFIDQKGNVTPFSEDGEILPPTKATEFPKVPLTRDLRILKDVEMRTQLTSVLSQLPEEGPLSLESIGEVALEKNGQISFTLLGSNSVVKMSNEDVPIKIQRVSKVISYLKAKNLSARVIDSDFTKKVLVRLRHRR
ncbi:MAG: FtsQ-type POTRA domain-containing protein [Bdellovibrionales bacterium]|nr:FtsQ-type POTRA domain-containing protein [Bdellovibrionales bacterium]